MARKKKEATALAIPTDLETTLAPQRAEAERALVFIAKLDLSTQSNRDVAGKVLAEIRTRVATLETQRKDITGPILESKRKVDALFKPVVEFWQACDDALEPALLAATKAAEQAQIKALAVVAETSGQTDALTLTQAHTSAETPAGLDLRKTWTARIVDESLVPREYLCVDVDKIKRLVVAMKGEVTIPGIAVEQVESFAKGRT